MEKNITIKTILGRAETGVSRPFRCLLSDGRIAFVKRDNVGWNELIKEWVCARLAQIIELPIADFAQITVPKEIRNSELSSGTAFASIVSASSYDLSPIHVNAVSSKISSQILTFDYWVQNMDRSGGEIVSNSNLTGSADVDDSCFLIDHGNAFDPDFDPSLFFQRHVFSEVRDGISEDDLESIASIFAVARTKLSRIWTELPEDWMDDYYGDLKSTLDIQTIETTLLLDWTTSFKANR